MFVIPFVLYWQIIRFRGRGWVTCLKMSKQCYVIMKLLWPIKLKIIQFVIININIKIYNIIAIYNFLTIDFPWQGVLTKCPHVMRWEWERVGLLGKLIKPTNQIRACHFVKALVIMSVGVLNGGALDDVFIVLMQSRCNTFYSYYTSFLNKVEYKCWPSERTNLFIIPHGGSMGTWLKNVLLHASRERINKQVWTNYESHRHEVW